MRFEKVEKTLRRHKNKAHPKASQSIGELFKDPQIMHEYGHNLERDSKFYIDSVEAQDYGFTLFASQYTIDFFKQNIKHRKYLMDATFDSLPESYYQLLVIAIEYRNDVSEC